MANERYISVPEGLTAVHMFDLYGPILSSDKIIDRMLELFLEGAEGKLSDEQIALRVAKCRASQKGDPKATNAKNKKKFAIGHRSAGGYKKR